MLMLSLSGLAVLPQITSYNEPLIALIKLNDLMDRKNSGS